ncbi:PEP-CTERM sorting domain-containing protein [Desulfosarcina sp. OttesenSCG-928-G10]|nr:PEP-CTERM sorting domain-containing protein [Desulfosarcina sp. OttesenSCG-928-G10]MDL2320876.1 PEP-CTERM sorting domain-containing protein [Desulfosarcina sp. OttesenSCG-928-B08]
MKNFWVGLIAGLLLITGGLSTATATTLTSIASADNGYVIYISTDDGLQGNQFGSGSTWGTANTYRTELASGVNYFLHVYAYDTGVAAGFIGEFNLTGSDHMFSNGTTALVTNTTDWQGNSTGWGDSYISLTDYGVNGVSPWITINGVSDSAHWIWAGDTTASYFSTMITATSSPNPVPEPATLLLFGAGLAGLAAVSRKKRHKK